VLALAEEGETADLVRSSGIGVSVEPEAGVEAIEAALLRVVEIASRPYLRPPAALYDGRVHAVAAAGLLADIAKSIRRGGKTRAHAEPAATTSGAPLGERRR
jgi:hypothetical protein